VLTRIPRGKGNLGGHVPPHYKLYGQGESTVSCRKMDDAIDMRLGMKTGVSLRNHVLGGSPIPPGKVQFLRILSPIQA